MATQAHPSSIICMESSSGTESEGESSKENLRTKPKRLIDTHSRIQSPSVIPASDDELSGSLSLSESVFRTPSHTSTPFLSRSTSNGVPFREKQANKIVISSDEEDDEKDEPNDAEKDDSIDSGLLEISSRVEQLKLDGKKQFNFKEKRRPRVLSSDDDDEEATKIFDVEAEAESAPASQDTTIAIAGESESDLSASVACVSISSRASGSDSESESLEVIEDHRRVPPPLPKGKGLPVNEPRIKFIDLPEAGPSATGGANAPLHQVDVHNAISKLTDVIQSIPKEDVHAENPPGLRVDLYDHQRYGLTWLSWREQHFPGGGILADEMGLGKTIMIIGLVLKSKAEGGAAKNVEKSKSWISADTRKLVPSRTTLVVVPPSVMGQWEEEIKKKSRGMSVYCYHGPRRTTSAAVLVQNDFVLTTYQTLGSDIPKPADEKYSSSSFTSPLLRIHWERVVLDEGHVIRNQSTLAAQAACRLTAHHRWVVTGTPVHNKPADLQSLVKFLRLVPFDDPKVWNFWIGLKAVVKANVDRLNIIGKSLILRRTKDEVKLSGGNVKSIPPKTVIDVKIPLGEEERKIYDHLRAFAESQFKMFLKNHQSAQNDLQRAANNYVAGGRAMAVPSGAGDINYSHLFTLLLRLRQASVLPFLITTMLEDEDDVDSSFDADNAEHLYSLKNPVFSVDHQSAKLKQLYEDLEVLRQKGRDEGVPMEKVVVVSQWTSLLDVIHSHLIARDFKITSITGQVKLSDRMDIMAKFNNNPRKPQVMLLSLAAGGVGLNLIGANHLFFLDIHWNPQLEIQAQDRIHRFGQTKDVTIKRYISEDTMEERVLELQMNKLELANGLLSNSKNKSGAGLSLKDMRQLFEI